MTIDKAEARRPIESLNAVGAQVQRPVRPRAWMCELMQEDGTTRVQFVSEDPEGLRWNDAGEPSPYRVTPLYEEPTCLAAWLFICKRPGKTMTFASTHDTGSESWPWNEWTTVERFPLALAGPGVALWPNAELTGLGRSPAESTEESTPAKVRLSDS